MEDKTFYLLYFKCLCTVTSEEETSVVLPEGLILVEDFVTPEEEALLLAAVDWSSSTDDVTGEKPDILLLFLIFIIKSNTILK